MQITHQEARQLIHFQADEALSAQEKTVLFTHLKACFECRAYAAEIKELEEALLPVMKRRWNLHPIPLSIRDLKIKRNIKSSLSNVLAIRRAIIAFVFVMFVFSAWQFTRPGQQLLGLPVVIGAPVSTPSLESTNTTVSSENCHGVPYTVQADDTLSDIAAQFSVSKDELISQNGLGTETIHRGMVLMIPVCNFTPTNTLSPTVTSTLTPVISSATEPNGY
jgi:LysM repeat protein